MPNTIVHNVKLRWIWLAMAFLIVVVDQITKKIALATLKFEGHSEPVLPFFSWTLAYNPGAAFSFLSNAGGWQRYLFSGLAAMMSVAFVIWLLRMPQHLRILPSAVTLVLGGAIGNLIDRMTTELVNYKGETVYGVVIDFLHVHYGTWHFPIFNLADCAITLGTVLLLIDSFLLDKKRRTVAKS